MKYTCLAFNADILMQHCPNMLMLNKWEEIIVLIHSSPCQKLHNAFSKYTTYTKDSSKPISVIRLSS